MEGRKERKNKENVELLLQDRNCVYVCVEGLSTFILSIAVRSLENQSLRSADLPKTTNRMQQG